MVLLSDVQKLKTSTLDLLESINYEESRRSYLGMSELGHPCNRFLWYRFRWAFTEKIPARLRRLFRRGHQEEALIIADLMAIGYEISGTQTEFIGPFSHIKGHRDGVAEGVIEAPATPHLLELKTMNDKYFKQLQKTQKVQISHPKYYCQCQLYMHFGKMTRTLFIAVNKNDDSYYVERIRYDKEFAKDLVSKGTEIILSQYPPPKVYKPTWYECKWCPAHQICHLGRPMDKVCRTCVKGAPTPTGEWDCDGHLLTLEQQLAACDKYMCII